MPTAMLHFWSSTSSIIAHMRGVLVPVHSEFFSNAARQQHRLFPALFLNKGMKYSCSCAALQRVSKQGSSHIPLLICGGRQEIVLTLWCTWRAHCFQISRISATTFICSPVFMGKERATTNFGWLAMPPNFLDLCWETVTYPRPKSFLLSRKLG